MHAHVAICKQTVNIKPQNKSNMRISHMIHFGKFLACHPKQKTPDKAAGDDNVLLDKLCGPFKDCVQFC